MKLFEYAIVFNPAATKEDKDQGRSPKSIIVKPITMVLARDEKEVMLLAAREIPDEYTEKLDRVEIAIRPF